MDNIIDIMSYIKYLKPIWGIFLEVLIISKIANLGMSYCLNKKD
jgi:hypothetical protein